MQKNTRNRGLIYEKTENKEKVHSQDQFQRKRQNINSASRINEQNNEDKDGNRWLKIQEILGLFHIKASG
jgi:hypothetical protein